MTDWKPYDPTWLVELAKAQLPEEPWLPAALAACTMARLESAAYIHFVKPADPDEPGSEWQAAIDALTSHMRAGRIAAGFSAAIERCGAVLAAHAPPDGSPNELPDRLYLM